MKKMKIALISSEVVPFAKTGGLADVVSSLAIALQKRGHDARVIMPRYKSMKQKHEKALIKHMPLRVGVATPKVSIIEETLEGEVPVYTVDSPLFSERDGLYHDADGDYSDNAYRFALFSRASIALCKELNWSPDILHIHDWQAGPVAAYLQNPEIAKEVPRAKVVLTIHNLGYQGIAPKEDYLLVGMGKEESGIASGTMNYLQTAIQYSHAITTVSPSYAKEICTEEQGFGLHDLLLSRKNKLTGILNGIDYTIWNSSKDKHLPHPFSTIRMEGKAKLKQEICEAYGLQTDSSIPLVVMITRLAEQKGFVQLLDHGVLEQLLQKPLQCIVLGTGEKRYEQKLTALGEKYANFTPLITFDNGLSHRLEAAADFFLMPSVYEPCGLNQLFSLRYGAVPIVHGVGGLKDTVVDISDKQQGTGIVLSSLEDTVMYEGVERALSLWQDHKIYQSVQLRGMKKRFDWNASTKKYEKVYHNV